MEQTVGTKQGESQPFWISDDAPVSSFSSEIYRYIVDAANALENLPECP